MPRSPRSFFWCGFRVQVGRRRITFETQHTATMQTFDESRGSCTEQKFWTRSRAEDGRESRPYFRRQRDREKRVKRALLDIHYECTVILARLSTRKLYGNVCRLDLRDIQVYTYMSLSVYIHMYVYYVSTYIRIYMCVYIYMCARACVCVCSFMYTHVVYSMAPKCKGSRIRSRFSAFFTGQKIPCWVLRLDHLPRTLSDNHSI